MENQRHHKSGQWENLTQTMSTKWSTAIWALFESPAHFGLQFVRTVQKKNFIQRKQKKQNKSKTQKCLELQ